MGMFFLRRRAGPALLLHSLVLKPVPTFTWFADGKAIYLVGSQEQIIDRLSSLCSWGA